MLGDLREAESGFRKRTWMWVITVQFSLFNFGVWAPFLVLGPVVAQRDLGGARAPSRPACRPCGSSLVLAVPDVRSLKAGLPLVERLPVADVR